MEKKHVNPNGEIVLGSYLNPIDYFVLENSYNGV